MFGLRRRNRRDAEIEGLRLVAVTLLRERARATPDPTGYLASRHAEITSAPAPSDAAGWQRRRAALQEVAVLFAAAGASPPK